MDERKHILRRDFMVPLIRNPLALYLLGLCILFGATGLLGIGGSSTSHLPAWADTAWYLLLLCGGVLGIAGICWRDAVVGLLVEGAAMWPVAAGGFMYGAGLLYVGRWTPACALLAFGVAATARAMQVVRLARYRLRGMP